MKSFEQINHQRCLKVGKLYGRFKEVNLRAAIFSVWSYSFNMIVVKGISRKVPWEKMDHVLRPAGCFKPPVGHGLLRAVPEKSAGGHQIDPKAVPLWQRPSFWLSHTDRLRVGQLLGECSSPNLDAFVRKREITGCHSEAVIIPWVCVRGWESNDLQKNPVDHHGVQDIAEYGSGEGAHLLKDIHRVLEVKSLPDPLRWSFCLEKGPAKKTNAY